MVENKIRIKDSYFIYLKKGEGHFETHEFASLPGVR